MKKFTIVLTVLIAMAITTSAQWTPLTSGTSNFLYAIYFIDTYTGFALGINGTLLKTTNEGMSWTPITTGITTDFTDVRFLNHDTGYVSGRNHVLLKTTNGGTSWTSLNTGVSVDFTQIALNGNDIYVSGYNGKLIKSSDGGATWSLLNTGTSVSLYECCFVNSDTGYIVGYNGTILKTTNAGNSWVSLSSGTSKQLITIYFTDANTGYAAGGNSGNNTGIILRTTDAGNTWTAQNINNVFFGSIRFFSVNTGFVVGGDVNANTSTIYRTNDGGVNWSNDISSSYRQFGSSFPNSIVGYTCGANGTILKNKNIDLNINETLSKTKNNVMVYPNPATDIITLDFENINNNEVTMNIYNVIGGIVRSELLKQNQQQINIGDLANGSYMIEIKSKEWVEKQKLIIQK